MRQDVVNPGPVPATRMIGRRAAGVATAGRVRPRPAMRICCACLHASALRSKIMGILRASFRRAAGRYEVLAPLRRLGCRRRIAVGRIGVLADLGQDFARDLRFALPIPHAGI